MTDFNYNKAGSEYIGVAIASPPLGAGFLGESAIRALAASQALIQDAAKGGDPRGTTLGYLLCAFERLEGLFLIGKRILSAVADIRHDLIFPSITAPCMVAIAKTEVSIDFASLLYHAASTLDILARYYTTESEVRHTGYFRGSKNAIYALQPPDIRADYLWLDLEYFEREADVIFSGNGDFKGLRNFVAHENSVLGLSNYVFSAHILDHDHALVFDCELVVTGKMSGQKKLFPITKTTERIVSLVAWIATRIAHHYLVRNRYGSWLCNPDAIYGCGVEGFKPAWTNPLAVMSEFVTDDPSCEEYSAVAVTWNGMQTINRHLRPEVMNHVIQLHGL